MRNILVPIEIHSSINSVLATALLLGKRAALGADLLIKGGYTRSRLRKMIFGDATSHILARAKLPVLMAS